MTNAIGLCLLDLKNDFRNEELKFQISTSSTQQNMERGKQNLKTNLYDPQNNSIPTKLVWFLKSFLTQSNTKFKK